MRVVSAIFVLVMLVACSGPFFVFPGGALGGRSEPVPSEWTFAGDYGTGQLETHPEEPYSVNVAYTIVGGRLYVNAGDTETRWVTNIAVDPRVRLRIDDAIYELRADRVTDAAQIEGFASAWTSQSLFRRDPREFDEVWIYELVRR